jgi:hypothetical protein
MKVSWPFGVALRREASMSKEWARDSQRLLDIPGLRDRYSVQEWLSPLL